MSALDVLPLVRIAIDGAPSGEELEAAVIALEIALRACEPAACEVRLRDPDGSLGAALALGANVRVRIGADGLVAFDGTIAAIEIRLGPSREREVRVLACDALETLRRRMPVRVLVDATFADAARELTADLGIDVRCPHATPLHRRIVQHRRSDLEVLADLAERAGLAFHLHAGTLVAYPLEGEGEPIELDDGATVREATVVRSAAPAASGVDVCGWDSAHVQARRGVARGEETPAARGFPPLALTGIVVESDAHADSLARSQLRRRALAGVRFEAVVEGDPRCMPGSRVALAGRGPAGPYTLTRVVHRLDGELGFVSELASALPRAHPPRDDAQSATLGVVVDVRDPESLGRVKVQYPALDGAESDWLQVLAAGAGGGKGLVALPSVDDNVLVLLLDGDPAHGIVLGALYGQRGLPARRAGAFSGYAFYSPQGHVIELDDAGALSLYAAGGSFLSLGKTTTTLHCAGDLTIDVPGNGVTIRADRVDIERA